MAALVVYSFIPRHERQHAKYERCKQWEKQVRRALNPAKGKGRGKKGATGHGASATGHIASYTQWDLDRAQAATAEVAVGLQMKELDFLFSIPALVGLQCALQTDSPQHIPEWWSPDTCIVCGNANASVCHALSSEMDR